MTQSGIDDNTAEYLRLAFEKRNERGMRKLERLAAVYRALAEAQRVINLSVPDGEEKLLAVSKLAAAGNFCQTAIEASPNGIIINNRFTTALN